MSQIYVVVATVGRPVLTRRTIELLSNQTRRPDKIIVVGSSIGDVEGVSAACGPIDVTLSAKGLPRQRNHGLTLSAPHADYVVFFDDDFIPSESYLEQIEGVFERNEDIVGLTGTVLADGINGEGISLAGALERNARANAGAIEVLTPRSSLYGCNMAIRTSAATDLRFDENLPLYGWLEDVDFSYRLSRRGRLALVNTAVGVHMGVKSGRTSGVKLGYSQIANSLYLKNKGTIDSRLATRLILQNLYANVMRSVVSETFIDRRGRLRGNLMAIRDAVIGKIHPTRIETLVVPLFTCGLL